MVEEQTETAAVSDCEDESEEVEEEIDERESADYEEDFDDENEELNDEESEDIDEEQDESEDQVMSMGCETQTYKAGRQVPRLALYVRHAQ